MAAGGAPPAYAWSPSPGAAALSLPEQIAESIGGAILRGELDPGERLHEQDIAERFAQLVAEVRRDSSAYDLAGIFSAQAVLDPRESRAWLACLLEVHQRRPQRSISKHQMANWPTTY